MDGSNGSYTTPYKAVQNLRTFDGPGSTAMYSPLSRGTSSTTPGKGLGLIAAIDTNKENERPVTPLESQSRKNKHSEGSSSSSSMGIKAKRLKKLTDQLPDIGGLEDIVKMQQELTEQQNKTKSLEETVASLQKQADDQRKETESVRAQRDQLKEQVNDQSKTKETLLVEFAAKMNQMSTLEQEKQNVKKELDDERDKIRRLQDEKDKLALSSGAQSKRLELLEATLRENAAQLMIQQQEHKETLQELSRARADYSSKEDQIRLLQEENKAVTSKLAETETELQSRTRQLEDQINDIKKEYFYSVALGVKLNMSLYNLQDPRANVEIQNLYDSAQVESVPVDLWPKWIVKHLDKRTKTL